MYLLYYRSYADNQIVHVPIGGRIPDGEPMFTHEGEAVWPKDLAVSALRSTGNPGAPACLVERE